MAKVIALGTMVEDAGLTAELASAGAAGVPCMLVVAASSNGTAIASYAASAATRTAAVKAMSKARL